MIGLLLLLVDIDCIILVVNSVSAMLNHDRKLRKLSATKVWDGKSFLKK